MKKIITSLAIVLSMNSFAQTVCFNTPDGIDNTWTGGWSYKEYIVPAGFKIDSVYGNFDRVGYPVSNEDFIFSFCAGTTVYDQNIATSPFNYVTTTTSLYDIWIDLTSFNYSSVGVVRVFLPVNAGATWNNLCFAISPITSSNCLVAQYNFSGNAADSSGNGLNGTVYGATLVPDRFGNPNSAYNFDASLLNHIEVLDNSLFNFQSSNQMSISFWIKTIQNGPLNDHIFLSKQTSAGSNQLGWNCSMLDPEIYMLVKNGPSGVQGYNTSSSNGILNNIWHHIVYTFDNGNAKAYIDGLLKNSSTSTAEIGDNTGNLNIGKANWSNDPTASFTGSLDDINIYNCAISQQEVDSLFNVTSVGVEELQTNNLKVYPNPTSNVLNIENGQGNYIITDVFGRIVKEVNVTTNNFQLNTSSIKAGIYFLISTEDNSSVKFIKQ